MSKKTDEQKKNIVVVGGGYAGIHVVQYLTKQLDHAKYNLILLSPRPYYLHLIAALRMLVSAEGKLEERALVPFDRLQGVTYVQGSLKEIEETAPGKGGSLHLANGDTLPYAVLVLATGSKWPGILDFPESEEGVTEHVALWRRRFAQAAGKHIVIAGGGAVGIELAGEILDAYPSTKVTIVHSGTRLLNDVYPDKFRKAMEDKVRGRGVELLDQDYVDVFPAPADPLVPADVPTRAGKTLKDVALVVPAFGARPNAAVAHTLGAGVLTDAGFVKVQPTLEVPGHPGVFAAGDILDWAEQKQAGKAMGHASVVTANVLAFLAGRPQKKLYKNPIEMIIVPVGRTIGGGYVDILWGITVGNWLSSIIKGKDLLIGMARGKLNY